MVIHVNFNFFQATFFDNIIKEERGSQGVGVKRCQLPPTFAFGIQNTRSICALSSLLLYLAFSTSFGKLNNKKYATINSGTKLGSGHTTKSPVQQQQQTRTDPVPTTSPVPIHIWDQTSSNHVKWIFVRLGTEYVVTGILIKPMGSVEVWPEHNYWAGHGLRFRFI